MKKKPQVQFSEAFNSALGEELLMSARRMLMFRNLSLCIWIAIALGWSFAAAPQFINYVWILASYLVFSLLLDIVGNRYPAFLKNSWVIIPILDIPYVYFFQAASIDVAPWSGMEAGLFNICIYITFIIISAYSFKTRWIVFTSISSLVFGLLICIQFEIFRTIPGMIAIMFLSGLVVYYFPRRMLQVLNHAVSEANFRNRLTRYFSPAVAEKILQSSSDQNFAEKKEVTILFSDIRNFTSITERLKVEETVADLNDYLSSMMEVISGCHGTADKFMGDGILAYFGAPVDVGNHAHCAVHCAQNMMLQLAKLNTRRTAAGKEEFRIGIGIHTGEVLMGNIGPASRMDFTIIGDAVNVASRLEALTKELHREILISESTMALLPEKQWQPIGTFLLKGKSTPTEVFAPASNVDAAVHVNGAEASSLN